MFLQINKNVFFIFVVVVVVFCIPDRRAKVTQSNKFVYLIKCKCVKLVKT